MGRLFDARIPHEAIEVLPLLHLASSETKWSEAQFHAWQAYESRAHPRTAAEHSYELRRLLEALKEPSGWPMKGEAPAPSWRQEKALLDENLILSWMLRQRVNVKGKSFFWSCP